MSNGFVHSVKVPRLYKTAANIVRSVREDGGSLKSLIYQKKHPNVSGIYALTFTTLQKRTELDYLVRKTRILLNEPRLDPWLARVLITELIWGKQCLKTDCKPVQTILTYEKQLREELKNIDNIETPQPQKKTVRKPRYVRINTLVLPIEEAISCFQDEGWILLPNCSDYSSYLDALMNLSDSYFIQDFHIPELFAFPHEVSFHNHQAYLDGKIILQDKASCLPAYILNPEPGSVVLDMCAAPGMKTSHLAARLQNEGKIYASEIDSRRYATLCELIKVTESTCVKTIQADALLLDPNDCPDVDYILVDPTCSGSGMVDRQLLDTSNEMCNPERLKSLQAFQVFLLRHALLSFPTAKKVIYSTCSVNCEENEQVVDEILESLQDSYRLVSAKDVFGKNWINYSSKDAKCSDNCLYTRPEVDCCNGFFVAIFERNFDVPLPEYKRKKNREAFIKPEEPKTEEGKSNKRKRRGKRKSKHENPVESASSQAEETALEIYPESDTKFEEEVHPSELNETEECQNENEEPRKKKKKKSKRKDDEVDVQENNENDFEAPVTKKSKKSKLPVVIPSEITCDEEDVEKKKKKKKKKKKEKDTDDVDAE